MADLPANVAETKALLAKGGYLASEALATSVFLALTLKRPLLLEGEAGVGKTELAKVLADVLGRPLVRLQCYEGLDLASAAYEWNHSRQLLHIRAAEAGNGTSTATLERDIYSADYLLKRPLLQALELSAEGKSPVLLIDELDRADEPFEAFLLEILADYQITVPELGTIQAKEPPITILTSNRTREVHDAVRRRCFYVWIDYPTAARETEILRLKVPEAPGSADGADRRIRPVDPQHGPLQESRHRREHQLGAGADLARLRGAGAGGRQFDARHAAEIPGRHRPHSGNRGRADPGAGQIPRSGNRLGRACRCVGAEPRHSTARPPRRLLEASRAGKPVPICWGLHSLPRPSPEGATTSSVGLQP